MGLLFAYSLRNLAARRFTTLLTAGGMALVVFVFAAILMLAEGLEKTLVDTGSPENVVAIRRSSTTEVQSAVERSHAALVETLPEIAVGDNGRPMAAKELVVLINLKKRGTGSPANVVIRGISEMSYALRPQVRLAAGRLPGKGLTEIAVGRSVAERFKNAELGGTLEFAMRKWRVVGIFDAGSTGFSSEIWGDVDQLLQAFRRPVYSSVIFRLKNPAAFNQVKQRIESDPRLTLEAKRETTYYREQSAAMAKFLRILGTTLTAVFSIGAIVGAMITMYAAVANRTGEIGTLRALGFQRRTILTAFLLESLFLGLTGGCAGLLLASLLQFFTVSTTNFQTFSELAFGFYLSGQIIADSLLFSLFMGFLGGILPAYRASRMNLVAALREV
ncbi:ABC transporter permease [Desulfoglaeba alkanexedens]|uniref:ABC transporter permease n=1 Tax=Desulfoglaeba alkanexedens ALDC TaxID=980445 RepID=A0A4P8L4M9_9BACT|nr:ABC transporter permease [Desulfoglaeba alkanexedens]QCQ22794.1 ABC transporter permease [Desulfoglaeba alkanexedens ALDC]